MSRWERWTTKPNPGLSLSKFMAEAPMAPMASSDPKAEAERQGLEFAGFGWYRDPKTGKRVAKIEGDKLVQYGADAGTAATTHTGNPTNPASGMTPASKARSMGLQSDGSGGYVDPSTGQVVARTVNNELVFYDAQGGAISDGSGGEQLTQSSPSWVDPVTGLIIVPPAQPESPEEQAAVPDSTPALAPMGLDAFFNKRKLELYRQQALENEVDADIEAQQMELDEILDMHPGMRQLHTQMMGVIERANATQDPTKMAAAALAQGIIEDEAGQMLKYFAMGKEEDLDETIASLKTQIITRAKMEEMEGREGWENAARSLDDEEYEVYSDARRKRRENTEWLDDTHDENTGVPDAPRLKAGKDYPEEIEGDQVVYTMKPYRVEMNQPLVRKAREAGRQAGLNMRNFKDAVTVEWDVKDEIQDPKVKKAAALEAVKLWRDEVLPTLPAGTIVVANPTETDKDKRQRTQRGQRERIYQMAGMGNTDARGIMAGLVTDDGTIVPVRPTAEQRKKMQLESKYINLIHANLNNDETKLIYEMLFT